MFDQKFNRIFYLYKHYLKSLKYKLKKKKKISV